MSQPIKALLFDLGGVVIDLNFDRAFETWANYAKIKPSIIKSRWSQDEVYEKHERGEIEGTEYFDSLRKTLGIDLTDEHFTEGWNAIFLGGVSATAMLLERLKNRLPLYAFSNVNATHMAVWTKDYGKTLAPFHTIFCSYKIGKRKPEASAFKFVASEMSCDFDEIMFFDDTEPNVSAAKALGIQAVLVTSPNDVIRAVETVL